MNWRIFIECILENVTEEGSVRGECRTASVGTASQNRRQTAPTVPQDSGAVRHSLPGHAVDWAQWALGTEQRASAGPVASRCYHVYVVLKMFA